MEKIKILKAVDIINDSVSEYEGERPFLSTGDLNLSTITNLELHTFSEKPSRANQNVSSGDIILARMQGTVKVKVINNEDENIIVSTGFLVLRPKSNADCKYLFHLLKSSNFQSDKDKLCTGATQRAINNSNFEKLEIPLPPLATQQRIAAILDQANAIIQNNRAIVQKYDALTQSLFLDMFGDPVKNEKGWEKKELKNITLKIGSGSTPKGGKENYKSEGISLIRSMNVYDNEFYYKDLAFIDNEQANKLKNVIVEENDVLFNITGASVCRCAIVPKNILPARVNQHVAIIRPKKEILNYFFLNHLLISIQVKRDLLKLGSGGGAVMEAITKEQLENYHVILPSITIQNQFAERVAVIEAQKQQAQLALSKSEELFQSLLQRAFKGELN